MLEFRVIDVGKGEFWEPVRWTWSTDRERCCVVRSREGECLPDQKDLADLIRIDMNRRMDPLILRRLLTS